MQTSKLKSITSFKIQITRTVCAIAASKNDEVKAKPWRHIPGPSTLPLIGQLHHFLPGGELDVTSSPDSLRNAISKYGAIFRVDSVFGKPALLYLSDPESVEKVLRNENVMPIRPEFYSLEYYRKKEKKYKEPTGLVTDHGHAWKDFRSKINPVLLQPKTIKRYTPILDEIAVEMVDRLKEDRDENNMIRRPFDMELNLWALEAIGALTLGYRLNCLDPELPEDGPEIGIINCIHELFSVASHLDYKPNVWRYFRTPMYKKATEIYDRHETLANHFVKIGVERIKTNKNNKNTEKSVLEKLLEIDEQVATIMASDMLFAGVETPATSITTTIYLLATHPEIQDKLRQEILSKSEKRPYLKACLKESLRIMPVVPENLRLTTKEHNVLGYRVPKGTHVIFTNRDMSLMEDQFPRAKEFIPERWICGKSDPLYYGNAHPFVYVPFGFGVRGCAGHRISDLMMETLLSRLIENFNVSWFGDPPKMSQLALSYFQGPFNFRFNDIKYT